MQKDERATRITRPPLSTQTLGRQVSSPALRPTDPQPPPSAAPPTDPQQRPLRSANPAEAKKLSGRLKVTLSTKAWPDAGTGGVGGARGAQHCSLMGEQVGDRAHCGTSISRAKMPDAVGVLTLEAGNWVILGPLQGRLFHRCRHCWLLFL